ncbi:MAG: IS110 family transposase [Dehalococcoidia bacterium]
MNPRYAGIDVSKGTLDVALTDADGRHAMAWDMPNNREGIRVLVRQLRCRTVGLVVLEASGGYERAVVCALSKSAVPTFVANPLRTRQFAQSRGQLAKTDRLDARMLADYGRANNPLPRLLLDKTGRHLQGLVIRRLQLVAQRAAEKNRLSGADPCYKPSLRRSVNWLNGEVKLVTKEIKKLIASQPTLRTKDELLRSIPGVGPAVSAALLALLPELGRIEKGQLAALVGVAPFPADSGLKRGKRMIQGGRRLVRSALYMGALVGKRYNPALAALYTRLKGANKPTKVALVACMRKLLNVANAIVRDRRPWTATPLERPTI